MEVPSDFSANDREAFRERPQFLDHKFFWRQSASTHLLNVSNWKHLGPGHLCGGTIGREQYEEIIRVSNNKIKNNNNSERREKIGRMAGLCVADLVAGDLAAFRRDQNQKKLNEKLLLSDAENDRRQKTTSILFIYFV